MREAYRADKNLVELSSLRMRHVSDYEPTDEDVVGVEQEYRGGGEENDE